MKEKNYKQKRIEMKKEKREGMKQDFESTLHRKKFVEGIKRQYRALKRSEKQVVKKHIKDNIDGIKTPRYFQEPNDGGN